MSEKRLGEFVPILAAGIAGVAVGATGAWLYNRARDASSPRKPLSVRPDVEVFEPHDFPASSREAQSNRSAHSGAGAIDEVNPLGDALVTPESLVDPTGARRRLSLPRARGPVVIGVAGASGSGKTSIADLLAARLSHARVTSMSSDSYYKTVPPGTDPADYNFDHPASIEFDLLADHLERIRNGEDVDIPHYDFVHHQRTKGSLHVCGSQTDVIIVEGIFVLWSERVRAVCDITLFTSEDLDICLARRLKRDIGERGRTIDSVLAQYVRFVRTGYHQFVAPSMAYADFIIPRARDNVTAIDMLAADLQRRINNR